jgi:glycosyltransferase involved in cell wall biosynthesis
VNPFNWIKVGFKLKREKADLIVVRYWLPFMGPSLGTIIRILKKNHHSKVVAITDNVLPHEKRPGDRPFTRYFLKSCDAFITMSEKVLNDLRLFEAEKPAQQVLHPLYDNFGDSLSESEARSQLGLPNEGIILLFFGFIRKYKGLDLLLNAVKILKDRGVTGKMNLKLMIAGEFYEDSKFYMDLIQELGIEQQLIQKTDFIQDSEVKYYLCAADVVVQPYRNATQSGVTPLSYHFEKPMIVTNVGGLPQLVPHGKAGLVCEPNPESIANAIEEFCRLGGNHFLAHLRIEKQQYSWKVLVDNLTKVIFQ